MIMKDIDGNPTGVKIRDFSPVAEKKSITEKKSKMSYFFSLLDLSKPITICEWEIDMRNLWSNNSNILWLPSINMLNKAIEDIRKKSSTTIYLLVDNDEAAQIMIDKINADWVFDSRSLLGEYKDINEYICTWWQIDTEDIKTHAVVITPKEDTTMIPKDSLCLYQGGKAVSLDEEIIAQYIVTDYDIIGNNGNLFQYSKETGLWNTLNDFELGKIVIDYIKIGIQELWKSKVTRSSKNDVIDFIRIHAENEESKKLFSSRDTMEIALDDVILNIESKETRSYCKEDYRMKKFPYSYADISNPDLEEPKARNQFLDKALEGYDNPESIKDFLQEYLGYLMIPSNKYEKSLLIRGEWSNGKWTILKTFLHVLGESNCSSIGMHELTNNQNLSLLLGSMANFDFDMKSGVKIDDGAIKKLLVSEPITAKEVFQKPINFAPMCKFLMATNELPWVNNIDRSVTRRFCFLELFNSFEGKENFSLKEEIIENELVAIFKRWLEGLERLIKRDRFDVPKAIDNVVKEFVDSQDTIKEYLETMEAYEKCNASDEQTCYVLVNTIHNDYCQFCKSISEKPEHRNMFSKRIKSLWYKLKKIKWQRAILWLREKM